MSLAQKVPLARSLPQLAQRSAQDELSQVGLRLPGHVIAVAGQIVTVNFDVAGATIPQATMALATSQYAQVPVQFGDKGYATTADAYMGAVTGLGGGSADLTQWGNLSNLVWVPVANESWTVLDTTAYTLYSANRQNYVSVGNSAITLKFGSKTVVINSSGVTIDGILWDTHYHPGVQSGGSNTGPPA